MTLEEEEEEEEDEEGEDEEGEDEEEEEEEGEEEEDKREGKKPYFHKATQFYHYTQRLVSYPLPSAKQCLSYILYTVEPPNKGQIWNKFFVRRLSLSRRLTLTSTVVKLSIIIPTSHFIFSKNVLFYILYDL